MPQRVVKRDGVGVYVRFLGEVWRPPNSKRKTAFEAGDHVGVARGGDEREWISDRPWRKIRVADVRYDLRNNYVPNEETWNRYVFDRF